MTHKQSLKYLKYFQWTLTGQQLQYGYGPRYTRHQQFIFDQQTVYHALYVHMCLCTLYIFLHVHTQIAKVKT